MATRSNVVILKESRFPIEEVLNVKDDENVIFYHHWDGYPENMTEVLKKCIKNAEWDREVLEEEILNYDNDFRIEDNISADIEYLYLIDCEDKTLRYIHIYGTTIYFDEYGEEIPYEEYIFG